MTKRIFSVVFIAFALTLPNVQAQPRPPHQPMNKIQLTLVKEEWAKTTSARVVVNMAAVLDKSGLANTHRSLNDKLKSISNKGEWHITGFNRFKDSSGLEKLNATAEARLPESELPALRDRAKKISMPGQQFTISNIDFTPSMADMQTARAKAREGIYQAATQELARVNKELGNGYFIHAINFIPNQPIVRPPQYKAQARMMLTQTAAAPASEALAVSDKVTLSAVVMISAQLPKRD